MTDPTKPLETTLEIAGEPIPISPLRVGELPQVIGLLRPLAGRIDPLSFDWLELFGEHGPALMRAIAIAARRPLAWVEALLPDEAVRLGSALIQCNADFFALRLAPELERISGRMGTGGIGGSASYAASD